MIIAVVIVITIVIVVTTVVIRSTSVIIQMLGLSGSISLLIVVIVGWCGVVVSHTARIIIVSIIVLTTIVHHIIIVIIRNIHVVHSNVVISWIEISTSCSDRVDLRSVTHTWHGIHVDKAWLLRHNERTSVVDKVVWWYTSHRHAHLHMLHCCHICRIEDQRLVCGIVIRCHHHCGGESHHRHPNTRNGEVLWNIRRRWRNGVCAIEHAPRRSHYGYIARNGRSSVRQLHHVVRKYCRSG
mmetsp:Transcript_28371/g.39067  ORF Transcript_28371/g.39067 Transcript_28371/m.39067 type:complete len:240 (-) Transcript_28371:181-900(-)